MTMTTTIRALAIGKPFPSGRKSAGRLLANAPDGARRHIFLSGHARGARSTRMPSQFLPLAIGVAVKGVEKAAPRRDAGAIRASWKRERAALIRNANATSVANDAGGGGGRILVRWSARASLIARALLSPRTFHYER